MVVIVNMCRVGVFTSFLLCLACYPWNMWISWYQLFDHQEEGRIIGGPCCYYSWNEIRPSRWYSIKIPFSKLHLPIYITCVLLLNPVRVFISTLRTHYHYIPTASTLVPRIQSTQQLLNHLPTQNFSLSQNPLKKFLNLHKFITIPIHRTQQYRLCPRLRSQ